MANVIPFLILLLFSVVLALSLAIFPARPLSLLRLSSFWGLQNGSHAFVRNGSNGGTCDYSYGRWVWDENYRVGSYSEECQFLDPGFQCRMNGRKDAGYLHWRWQPHGCDVPRFNATEMLERSRNKRIVFVGDSIGRNHWESLLCMLSQAVTDQSSIYEQQGLSTDKHTGVFFLIRFQVYNLTVEYYRAPFLVLIQPSPANSSARVRKVISIDQMQWQAKHWVDADVLIFHVGRWWSDAKTVKKGYYFQEGGAVNMTMDVKEGFRRSLQTWKQWVVRNTKPEKTKVFFASHSPSHYSNGTWDNGGSCRDNKEPETNLENVKHDSWNNKVIAETIAGMTEGRKMVQLLNVTYSAMLRKDAHPSNNRENRTAGELIEDCSHWCLPGVPDTWNELLYAYLLEKGYNAI